jgi:hypothetical protein
LVEKLLISNIIRNVFRTSGLSRLFGLKKELSLRFISQTYVIRSNPAEAVLYIGPLCNGKPGAFIHRGRKGGRGRAEIQCAGYF